MKNRSHPTLSDVAHVAGVGVATASRVINGGTHVSAKTLKKVQDAIKQLGYMPNHAARILKGGRTKTIGLIVPSIADSFFSTCAEAAEEVARVHDSLLIVAVSSNDTEIEMSKLEVLMRHRPDGLLIVPADTCSKKLISFVKQSSIPIVTIDRPLPGCASVLTNNFEAAVSATNHLIEHGHRRILCFGAEPRLYTIRERLRGYRQAMEQAGLTPLIDTAFKGDELSAKLALSANLSGPHGADAIFTLKNSATIATFQALQKLRVSVPAQVALLGFDDFELASTLQPAVSVMRQPIEDIGRHATELLFALLGRMYYSSVSRKKAHPSVVLPNRLMLRASCGC
jgi:LacI family transcriptional regulator